MDTECVWNYSSRSFSKSCLSFSSFHQ